MHLINSKTFFLILTLIVNGMASKKALPDYLYSTWQSNNTSISYFPGIQLGTHRNGIGLNGEGIGWIPFSCMPLGLGLKLDVNGMYYEEYFGIPGRSLSAETGSTLLIGWGKKTEFGNSKWMRVSPYRHSIHYRFSYYLTTDQTSQAYAEYQYELNVSNKSFLLRVGNDDETFIRTDRFRSAAVDFNVYVNKSECLLGYSFGLKLWHGDYTKQLYLNKTQTYDFEHIFGGEYSLGLLYGSFVYNCFKFSIGYDSDRIRTFFQNGMHKIMNNGMVPRVRRDDRVYIELSLFGNSGQY